MAVEKLKKAVEAITERIEKPGIRKKYLKATPICKVTFTLPAEASRGAQNVAIVGDFNAWNREANPLKRQRNGDFTVTLDLERGRSYRFRYLIDGVRWENDWAADGYVQNEYGSEDSVVVL